MVSNPDEATVRRNASNESGRDEIYVQPYPGPGGRQQVSAGGGTLPAWSRAGGELFFGGGSEERAARLMVVSVSEDGGLKVGTPRALFDIVPPVSFSATPLRGYDVSPDGKHFVAIEVLPPAAAAPAEVPRRAQLVRRAEGARRRRASRPVGAGANSTYLT